MSALILAGVSIATVVAFAPTQGPGEALDPARGVVLPEAAALGALKRCSRTGVPTNVFGTWAPAAADRCPIGEWAPDEIASERCQSAASSESPTAERELND